MKFRVLEAFGKVALLLGLALGAANPAHAQYVEYMHTDALGTPVAVTDSNRIVVQHSEYEPFGKLLNRPALDEPGYTGHVADSATGLDYMQQRYFDPTLGRFLSVDPIESNGNSGSNFSRYWYANNNPYKFTDPDGRCVDGVNCDGMAQSFGKNPDAARPLAPYAAVGMGIMALPLVVETGLAAMANPGTTTAVVSTIADGVAGPALGGGSISGPAGAVSSAEGVAVSRLKPGPFAGESIPARSASQTFNSSERAVMNRIGSETGCHSCGTTTAGTKSGNFVPDHQPVSSLNKSGAPQRLYPQCLSCSKKQGLEAIRQLRGQK